MSEKLLLTLLGKSKKAPAPELRGSGQLLVRKHQATAKHYVKKCPSQLPWQPESDRGWETRMLMKLSQQASPKGPTLNLKKF